MLYTHIGACLVSHAYLLCFTSFLCQYRENATAQQIVDAAKKTTLQAWFDLCRTDPFARTLRYIQCPEHYTWQEKTHTWGRRRNSTPRYARTVGRMYSAHPSQGERYYLRVLLNHVHGPTSFQDLSTCDGVQCATFREACLTEASTNFMPSQLRDLFACSLAHCEPSDPRQLWDKHKHSLAEDFLHEARAAAGNPSLELTSEVEFRAIYSLQEHLLAWINFPTCQLRQPKHRHSPARCRP